MTSHVCESLKRPFENTCPAITEKIKQNLTESIRSSLR